MRFSTIVALVASVGLVAATPSSLVARSGDGNVEIAKRSGCGSVGPLGTGHFKWWITTSCTPGTQMYALTSLSRFTISRADRHNNL